jgi:uncharacterized membrane protein
MTTNYVEEVDLSLGGTPTAGRHGRPPASARMLDAVRSLEQNTALDKVGQVLQRVARPLSTPEARKVLGGAWLGHAAHPLFTDLPLGCWLGSGLLDLFGGKGSRKASQRLVAAGLVFAVPTVATGVSDWNTISNDRDRRVGVAHAALNTAVLGAYFMSWRQRRRQHHFRGVMYGLAGGGLAWASGYLGGHLSFRRGIGVGEPEHEPEQPPA